MNYKDLSYNRLVASILTISILLFDLPLDLRNSGVMADSHRPVLRKNHVLAPSSRLSERPIYPWLKTTLLKEVFLLYALLTFWERDVHPSDRVLSQVKERLLSSVDSPDRAAFQEFLNTITLGKSKEAPHGQVWVKGKIEGREWVFVIGKDSESGTIDIAQVEEGFLKQSEGISFKVFPGANVKASQTKEWLPETHDMYPLWKRIQLFFSNRFNLAGLSGLGFTTVFIGLYIYAMYANPTYRFGLDFISDLGKGDVPWPFNLALIVAGASMSLFGWLALRPLLDKTRRTKTGLVALAIGGLFLSLVGVFPSDGGIAHYVVAVLFFVFNGAALYLLTGPMKKAPELGSAISIFASVVIVLSIAFVVTYSPILETAAVAANFLGIALTALRLMKVGVVTFIQRIRSLPILVDSTSVEALKTELRWWIVHGLDRRVARQARSVYLFLTRLQTILSSSTLEKPERARGISKGKLFGPATIIKFKNFFGRVWNSILRYRIMIVVASFSAVVDWLTKYWITTWVPTVEEMGKGSNFPHHPEFSTFPLYSIIEPFLAISRVPHDFSFQEGLIKYGIPFSIIFWILRHYKEIIKTRLASVSFGLIIGGALGNFMDFLLNGAVLDWVVVWIRGGFAFNFADASVLMGGFTLALQINDPFQVWRANRQIQLWKKEIDHPDRYRMRMTQVYHKFILFTVSERSRIKFLLHAFDPNHFPAENQFFKGIFRKFRRGLLFSRLVIGGLSLRSRVRMVRDLISIKDKVSPEAYENLLFGVYNVLFGLPIHVPGTPFKFVEEYRHRRAQRVQVFVQFMDHLLRLNDFRIEEHLREILSSDKNIPFWDEVLRELHRGRLSRRISHGNTQKILEMVPHVMEIMSGAEFDEEGGVFEKAA